MLTIDIIVNKMYTYHMEKEFYSIAEIAELLKISRIAVFRMVRSGKIQGVKVGKSYVIQRKDLPALAGGPLTPEEELQLTKAVHRGVKEYGEALKLLGKE